MFVHNKCIYTQINPAVSACQFKRGPKVQDNPSLINSLFFANNYISNRMMLILILMLIVMSILMLIMLLTLILMLHTQRTLEYSYFLLPPFPTTQLPGAKNLN